MIADATTSGFILFYLFVFLVLPVFGFVYVMYRLLRNVAKLPAARAILAKAEVDGRYVNLARGALVTVSDGLSAFSTMWVGLMDEGRATGPRVKAKVALDGHGLRFAEPVRLPMPDAYDEVGVWDTDASFAGPPIERLSALVHTDVDAITDQVVVGAQIGIDFV